MGAVGVAAATPSDIPELADVAAQTFPLACPPTLTAADIAEFITANLSATRFSEYLDDPGRRVFVARDGERIVGYAMLIRGVADDADVRAAVPQRPAVELSKIYVLPRAHGGAASTCLMDAAVDYARQHDAAVLWLGVNQKNERAQRFYRKQGFHIAGTKTFTVGAAVENDYVMVRAL